MATPDVLELSVRLGIGQAAGRSLCAPIANDNLDREQELFERCVERELVGDVIEGPEIES